MAGFDCAAFLASAQSLEKAEAPSKSNRFAANITNHKLTERVTPGKTRKPDKSGLVLGLAGSLSYEAQCAKSSSVLEPCARFILLVFVTESCLKRFFFLACSINLQWNDRNEKP